MPEPGLEKPKVFGGYLLLKALGQGAMGDVSLARPLREGRGLPSPLVVKRLHAQLADQKTFVSRFQHEAQLAVAVNSPHVAKVYDVGRVSETLYIAMEYVDGWPLHRILDAIMKSGRHASVASVVDLISGGLKGLHALHHAVDPKTNEALGIVHRDIAPKNLMVGEDGKMRLIDLGLGRSNAQDWRTQTGMVMGSPGYMPPEQVMGSRVSPQADLYAMAIVMFEMLTLRNYIRRGQISDMLKASLQPKFIIPSQIRSDVPKGLDRILERALQYNPDQRFGSALEFVDALHKVVPPRVLDGGMTQLIDELFGEERKARKAELAQLLALPNPHQEFDDRPTQVYVMASGVVPDELIPTRHVSRPAASQRGGLNSPHAVRHDPRSATTPMPRPAVPMSSETPQAGFHSYAGQSAMGGASDKPVTLKTLIVAMTVMLSVGLFLGGAVVATVLYVVDRPPESVIVATPVDSSPGEEEPTPVVSDRSGSQTPKIAPKALTLPPDRKKALRVPQDGGPSPSQKKARKTPRRPSTTTSRDVLTEFEKLRSQADRLNELDTLTSITSDMNSFKESGQTPTDISKALQRLRKYRIALSK